MQNLKPYIIILIFVAVLAFLVVFNNKANNEIGLDASELLNMFENNTAEVMNPPDMQFIPEAENKRITDFISKTENYRNHGKDIFLGVSYGDIIYDASTYCEGCQYVMASYADKNDPETFYQLDILIKKDGTLSILNTEIETPEKFQAKRDKFESLHVIKRGETKFGITLDQAGRIKYGEYIIPAKIEGSDPNKNDGQGTLLSKTVYDFDTVTIFNFEKYNKVYFLADISWRDEVIFDSSAQYVFDKNSKSLTEVAYAKYFSPVQPFGYTPNGRYLALEARQDDGTMITIFDIVENQFMGYEGYELGWRLTDFRFLDNQNFMYKYKMPSSYANQEQTKTGTIATFGNI